MDIINNTPDPEGKKWRGGGGGNRRSGIGHPNMVRGGGDHPNRIGGGVRPGGSHETIGETPNETFTGGEPHGTLPHCRERRNTRSRRRGGERVKRKKFHGIMGYPNRIIG